MTKLLDANSFFRADYDNKLSNDNLSAIIYREIGIIYPRAESEL